MSVILQQDLGAYLDGAPEAEGPSIILIFGEPFLCRRALEAVVTKRLSGKEDFGYEPLDGAVVDVREAVRKAATFPLFSEQKVVALMDAKVFASPADSDGLLKKAQEKYEDGGKEEAARYFLAWMAASRIDFDDLSGGDWEKKILPAASLEANGAWIQELARHCRENALQLPDVKTDAGILEEAIEKGLPRGNLLILTSARVDRRLKLFQAIAEKGMVIDCTVPTGGTAAEKRIRDAILKTRAGEMLAESQKAMDPAAYAALCERTGFELGIFCANIEKLIAYAGSRSRITLEDVEAVLSRTKEDPIYELTGAVMEKDPKKALFFLNSLLRDGFHPMALLTALVNQIRKLLVAREFRETVPEAQRQKGRDFTGFKGQILPRLEAHGKRIEAAVSAWEAEPSKAAPSGREKKKSAGKSVSDLVMIKGGASAYPAFKLFAASERFEKDELIRALVILRDTERLLKSTSLSPRMLLEKVLLSICRAEDTPSISAKRNP